GDWDVPLRAAAPQAVRAAPAHSAASAAACYFIGRSNPSSLILHPRIPNPESRIANPESGSSDSGSFRLGSDAVATAVGEAGRLEVLYKTAHHLAERLAKFLDPLQLPIVDQPFPVRLACAADDFFERSFRGHDELRKRSIAGLLKSFLHVR